MTPSKVGTPTEREQRLQEVVLEYLQAADAGCAPTPKEVLTRHPELAAELTAFFADQEGLGPLLSPLRQLAAAAPAPTHLGDYEILEEIGRGGMGVVYRARQVSLNRPVAVKLLRDHALAAPAERERFRREAESAAHLDHPHIVPIYEVGEHAGQLYFSMKLIDGGSLAAPGAARDHAAPRAAAKLIATVARAVQHAHQRGILHRDLKPSNILLDGQGVPYVTDFGLAKRLEGDGGLTRSGAVVGTPEYVAPEQAQAGKRLTTAADVCGLGVVLYELLTGRVPFRGETDWQTVRLVVEQEPPPVRALAPGVDRDLETVCLKCLQKDPRRRYASAEALAEDLERWQAGVPIAARPVGRLERAWRWCRRRPAPAGLAAAVLLLVLGAVAAPSVGLVLLRAEQRQTEEARLAAVAAREEEARRRRQTRQALDMLTGPVIADWLGKQMAISREQKKFLEQALAIYTEFAAETGTDEASPAGLARAYGHVGVIQHILGRLPEAEEAYNRSVETYTQLASKTPGRPEYRKELVRVLNQRVGVLNETGRGKQAEAALRDLIPLQRQLVADSSDPEDRLRLGLALTSLSGISRERGKLRDAETLSREAVTIFEEWAAKDPDQFAVHHGRVGALNSLGNVLTKTRRFVDAERAYCDALKLHERLAASSPKMEAFQRVAFRRDLGYTHSNLASLLGATKRPREAEAAYREALKVRQQLVVDFPGHAGLYGELAATHLDLGITLASLGQRGDAEEAYRRAIALYKKSTAASPNEPGNRFGLARAHLNLGPLLRRMGRPEEAEAADREAYRLFQELADADPAVPDYRHYLAGSLVNRAVSHHRRGEWAEARRLLEEALPHHRAAIQANPHANEYRQFLCNNRFGLAQTFLAENQHAGVAEAVEQLVEAAKAAAAEAGTTFPFELMRGAAYLARCATLAEQDARLPDARRAELPQSYAERAMTTLRLAVKHGYKDAARLKQEPFFASVRPCPDFQELLAGLEKVQKTP